MTRSSRIWEGPAPVPLSELSRWDLIAMYSVVRQANGHKPVYNRTWTREWLIHEIEKEYRKWQSKKESQK